MSTEVHRHEVFYFLDGSLTLRAENTLYNVYLQVLCMKSTFFDTMVLLRNPSPQPTDSQKKVIANADLQGRQKYAKDNNLDGGSDERALVLLHTPAELDALFGFVFNTNHWSVEAPGIDNLRAILKLSHYYDIESARCYAIHHLATHDTMRPALRLHLGCYYDVEEWVGPAFQDLMSVSILDVTVSDEELMGKSAYRMLVRTHAKVEQHRVQLAFTPPDAVHSTECFDIKSCDVVWRKAWWGALDQPGILTALLHPDMRVPGKTLNTGLDKLKVDYGMSEACRVLTVSSIQGTPGKESRFCLEETYIANAIVGLTSLMRMH